MKPLRKQKRLYLGLLLPFGYLLFLLACKFPLVVEKYYSGTIFSWMGQTFGRFWALFPFSVAEILILAVVVVGFFWFGRTLYRIIRKKDDRTRVFTGFVATLSAIIGVGYFSFLVTCGFNYARPAFTTLYSFKVQPANTEDLIALNQVLIDDINFYSQQIQTKDDVMVHSAADYYALSKQAAAIFTLLDDEYPTLGGYTPPTKPVLFSTAMSYAEITGVYFPFTFECNVNVNHPDFAIPFTMMHELTHSKGFMQENEANYIAYLACFESDTPDFLYSASVMAYIYANNALAKVDSKTQQSLYSQLEKIPRADLYNNWSYWQQFKTPVAKISSAVNDSYLKANQQHEGVASYGMVVDLLIAHYKEEGKI